MTKAEWNTRLMPNEMDALEDITGDITPDEAFEAIVDYQGGIATAYQIKCIIRRVYDIEL